MVGPLQAAACGGGESRRSAQEEGGRWAVSVAVSRSQSQSLIGSLIHSTTQQLNQPLNRYSTTQRTAQCHDPLKQHSARAAGVNRTSTTVLSVIV